MSKTTLVLLGYAIREDNFPAFTTVFVKDRTGTIFGWFPSGDRLVRMTRDGVPLTEEQLSERVGFWPSQSRVITEMDYDPEIIFCAFDVWNIHIGHPGDVLYTARVYLSDKQGRELTPPWRRFLADLNCHVCANDE